MAIDPTRGGSVSGPAGAGGAGNVETPVLDAAKLGALQQMAMNGEVPLLDLRRAPADLIADPNLPAGVRHDLEAAMGSMREQLAEGPTNADAGRTLEWIGSLDPFARARSDLSVG